MATSTLFDQGDILTYFLTKGTFTYALSTNIPTGTETSGTLTRPNYTGYADVTVAAGAFGAQTVVNGVTTVSNSAIISFPTPTGNGTLPILGWALFDVANHMRRYGPLQQAIPAPVTGQLIQTPPGGLIISEG